MAALRRCLLTFNGIRCSVRSLGGSSVRHPVLRSLLGGGCLSLCTGVVLCAVPITQVESVSHEALIRRASSLVTDSTSTFLSQTTLALVDAFTQYGKAVHTLMALQKHYLSAVATLTPADENAVWKVILQQRAEVSNRREECQHFESSWTNAVSLSELAAEAAYNAGADQACVTARTNLQVAQAHVEQARQLLQETEKQLVESKAEEMARASAPSEEEEEVPEAYQRED